MKENFDDILKRKWEEQSFPMDQHHRAEMIELLEGKKRRRILPIWWIGSLVMVSALAGLFLLRPAPSSQPGTPAENKKAAPAESEIIHNSSIPVSQQADKDQAASSGQKSETSQTESLKGSVRKWNSKAGTSNMPAVINERLTDTPLSQNKQTETEKIIVPMVQVKDANMSVSDQSGTGSHYTQQIDKTSFVSKPTALSQVSADINTPGSESDIMPISEPESTTQALIEPTGLLDPLDVSGLSHTKVAGPGPVTPNTSFANSIFLFGEAGAALILPSTPDFTSGWKMRLGAGVGYTLSSKLGLSLSGGYILQQGGFDFERTSTVNQSGFGTRSNFNSLSPDRLHFVYTRLGAQYRLRRHIIDVHGGIQWLYGAQGTVVVKTQDQFAPDVTETSAYTWVVTDGLRQLHWTADVAYGYQITPRLAVMAGIDMYFSSFTVTDDALALEGYYWKGAFASLHPFITLNYLIYGSR